MFQKVFTVCFYSLNVTILMRICEDSSLYNHYYAILANHMKDNEWLFSQNRSQKYKVCHMTQLQKMHDYKLNLSLQK